MGALLNFKKLENFLILNFNTSTVVGTYLNPNLKHDAVLDELMSTTKHIINPQNLIFAGDFNCRLDKDNSKAEALMDFMEENNMTLVNKYPYKSTYICKTGTSVVDLIFSGEKIKGSDFKILDVHNRKHRILSCKFKFQGLTDKATHSVNQAGGFRRVNDEILRDLYINKYHKYIETNLNDKNIESCFDNIVSLLEEANEPIKKKNTRSKPWYDSECYILNSKLKFILKEIDLITDKSNSYKLNQLLNNYDENRKLYRALCWKKKSDYVRNNEIKIIQEAEQNKCYRILQLNKHFHNCNNIPMQDWENHFKAILNENNISHNDSLNLDSLLGNYTTNIKHDPLMEEEIKIAVKKMKNKKAPGPDKITNENIKSLLNIMSPEITSFFNLCLEKSATPNSWKHQSLKILYKGKGDTGNVNSYRGISLSSALYNLLDRALQNRMYASLIEKMPRNQYGFIKGKSTGQAIRVLVNEINETVYTKGKPLYALFLDLKKAFDSIDRNFIFKELVKSGKFSKEELLFYSHTLDANYIKIHDGVTTSNIIVQSNGVRQGGCTSPFLFNFSLADINEIIKHIKSVKLILYADDMVLMSENLEDLKEALRLIKKYLLDRKLRLNLEKCKVMKFRNKGRGKYSGKDRMIVDGENVQFVSEFTYLGVIFQASGICFTKHIEKRVRMALLATFGIRQLTDLSLETALKLFDLKISPIASYGIEIIWPYLSKNDFEKLEKTKSRYIKQLLGLSKVNYSRYVYEITDTDLFVHDLKLKYNLSDSNAFEKFFEGMLVKKTNIRTNFHDKLQTINQNVQWKTPCFSDRSIFTRYLCHGYHYIFCTDKSFHYEACDVCICKFCGERCSQYHINDCNKKKLKLRDAAKMNFRK